MKENSFLKKLLIEKEIVGLDLNSPNRFAAHRTVLDRKPMIKNVFREFHHEFMRLDQEYFGNAEGLRVELGAGVFPMRETYPEVLATDVVPGEHLDMVVDAQNMRLDSGSVRAIYGQGCFHHFPDPSIFFRELSRVLAPGGGAILIDPFYGPVSSLVHTYLLSEGFDKHASGWTTKTEGAMYGANQALSFVVFVRDRKLFSENFEQLELIHQKQLMNGLRYFLSGGLNFRMFVPGFLEKPLIWCEMLLSPLAPLLALHHIIVLRRRL